MRSSGRGSDFLSFAAVDDELRRASFAMTDIRSILRRATSDLKDSGSPSPRIDAEVLLMRSMGISRLDLFLQPDRMLSSEEADRFSDSVKRRCRGEPVAYILGEKEFWSLRFAVDREVLIPRPETECLVEEVLRRYTSPGDRLRLIDIGTGSGAIGVVLAKELAAASIFATDIFPGALMVARHNAKVHGVADRITFINGDLFASLDEEFDAVCSNPPYIPQSQYDQLPAGIRDFEPRGALLAGSDGVDFHRRIIREGMRWLKTGGWIFLEIGEGQRDRVESLFRMEGGYDDISCRKDYGGIDRVVSARKK